MITDSWVALRRSFSVFIDKQEGSFYGATLLSGKENPFLMEQGCPIV